MCLLCFFCVCVASVLFLRITWPGGGGGGGRADLALTHTTQHTQLLFDNVFRLKIISLTPIPRLNRMTHSRTHGRNRIKKAEP